MKHNTCLSDIDSARWLYAVRKIASATNERTSISGTLPPSGVGHSASILDCYNGSAVATALVMANINSIPLDWAARSSLGGANLNHFVLKQLPVLPPKIYLEKLSSSISWVELIVPRVLQLTFNSFELSKFAADLGYHGPPFRWVDARRHGLQCELDAIFARMYGLDRSDLEWILDAPPPSYSFPGLKGKEIERFDEYRTKRFVLHAFDQIVRGDIPHLPVEEV